VKLLYVATFILFRAKCMHLIDSVELRWDDYGFMSHNCDWEQIETI
jgi:hypothetical protein